MHLALIDQLSNNGKSVFHKLTPTTKVIMTSLFIASIIVSRDVYRISVVIAVVLSYFVISKLPLKEVLGLAMYPAFFSTLFALFEFQESFTAGLLIIFRGLGAALTMIFLITTTSYIDVFTILGLIVPKVIVDLLIFTYRSFFILLDRVGNTIRSIKLRGGFKKFAFFGNIRSLTGMTAVLLLHSLDMGERMYKIYTLRGYNPELPIQFHWKKLRTSDFLFIILSIMVLIGVLI